MTSEAISLYILAAFCTSVFELYHHTAHPGTRVTDRVIQQWYVWPDMHRDITH